MMEFSQIKDEVNKSINQLATTLNDDNIESSLDVNYKKDIQERAPLTDKEIEKCIANFEKEQLDLQVNPTCFEPCNPTVRFCCDMNLPNVFNPFNARNNKRIIYDVSSLRCCIEPCTVPVTIYGCKTISCKVYAIRVVGCIPYLVTAYPVFGKCGGQLTPQSIQDKQAAMCCSGVACVNNVICYRCTREEAVAACPSLTCENVKAAFDFAVYSCSDKWDIEFTGSFTLPTCM